ncbi:MAG: hypothetical protein ACFE0S_02900 [Rhodospirillales bacterium]
MVFLPWYGLPQFAGLSPEVQPSSTGLALRRPMRENWDPARRAGWTTPQPRIILQFRCAKASFKNKDIR